MGDDSPQVQWLISRITAIEARLNLLEAKKRSKFIKPTLEEVAAYCAERKNGIDAQAFCDHHERVGWVVGKNKTPMKNWQAAIRTWENTRKKDNGKPAGDGAREELLSALKNSNNKVMPYLSNAAKELFYKQNKQWYFLQYEVQSGIIAF